VRVIHDGRPVQPDPDQFLAASHTTAFLILRAETLPSCVEFGLYE
jgi:hypothetical protein